MNANDNPQQSSETPIVKRGRGRPRKVHPPITVPRTGSDPIPYDASSGAVNLDALFGELSPLEMSAADREEELRVVSKNTSVRLSLRDIKEARMAVLIIWLSRKRHIKKAEILKECLKRGLPLYFKEDEEERRKGREFISKMGA
jgi:hypothetical protein